MGKVVVLEMFVNIRNDGCQGSMITKYHLAKNRQFNFFYPFPISHLIRLFLFVSKKKSQQRSRNYA